MIITWQTQMIRDDEAAVKQLPDNRPQQAWTPNKQSISRVLDTTIRVNYADDETDLN